MNLDRRVSKIEEAFVVGSVNIPLSIWTKPIEDQLQVCKNEGININPIDWQDDVKK